MKHLLTSLLGALVLIETFPAAATDGTWANPAALSGNITITSGSADLTWAAGTPAAGDVIRFTGTAPSGFSANAAYFVVSVGAGTFQVATTPGGGAITAGAAGTMTGTGAYFSWDNSANWSGATIASGADAVANFNSTPANTRVYLNSARTIGTMNVTFGSQDIEFYSYNNTASSLLTFATTTGTPTINLSGGTSRALNFNNNNNGNINRLWIGGNQGLNIDSGALTGSFNTGNSAVTVSSPTFRVYSGMNWSLFSGTVTLIQGNFDPQAANTIPVQRLVLGTGNNFAQFGLFNSRNQTVGGLDGSTNAYLANNGSTPATLTTLTVGSLDQDGTFNGTIGKTFVSPAADFRSNISITKTGIGTQRLNGNNYAGGTMTVNGGTLLVNGSHNATLTTTISGTGTNIAATTGQGGKYQVNTGGTLGGTGTIKPFDTLGGTVMVNINSGGKLSPGDPAANGGVGTLTLDGSASSASALIFASGGLGLFDLGAGNTSDVLKILNAQANDVFFNSTVLTFNDTTAGGLSGQYLLFDLDADNGYNGLTTDGSDFITAGLSVGSGLEAYGGSTLQVVGQDIYLNVAPVPEPSTYALLGFGLLGLATVVRRRQS
jgi:autotransporter-associated beta strand protein